MTKYNKAFGAILGGILGILVTTNENFPKELADPGLADSLGVLLGSLFGTYIAPKNTD